MNTLKSITLTVIAVGILYIAMFRKMPDPNQGWQCQECAKNVLSSKSKLIEAGWTVVGDIICSGCKNYQ